LKKFKTGSAYRITGFLLILSAIFFNEWTLVRFIHIPGPSAMVLFHIVLRSLQLLLISFGLFFLLRKREKLAVDIKKLILLGLSLVFSAIILEIGLRLMTKSPAFNAFLPLIPNESVTMVVDFPGLSNTTHYSTNEWGMRGDPIPKNWDDLKTIFTIGGSTTHCQYLSDDKTWPALLQKLLRQDDGEIMIQNAGLDGQSTWGHRLMMQEVIPKVKPDYIIILAGVNDLHVGVRKIAVNGDNPYVRSTLIKRILAASRTLQLIFKWYQILIEKVPIVDRTEHVPLIKFAPPDLDKNLPLYDFNKFAESVTNDFESNVRDIIKIAGKLNIKLLFLTQPTIYENSEYWDNKRAQWFYPTSDAVVYSCATEWKIINLLNRKLEQICREDSITFFDLEAVVPHTSEYFYDSFHFTEKGAEEVSQLIYQYIDESGFLKE